MLSDTKNLLYFRIKSLIMKQEMLLLGTAMMEHYLLKMLKQEVLSILHFWRHLTHVYNTVDEI